MTLVPNRTGAELNVQAYCLAKTCPIKQRYTAVDLTLCRFLRFLPMASFSPLPGRTVSHYRVLERLGRRVMGVVYKAEDVKLHRPEIPAG